MFASFLKVIFRAIAYGVLTVVATVLGDPQNYAQLGAYAAIAIAVGSFLVALVLKLRDQLPAPVVAVLRALE